MSRQPNEPVEADTGTGNGARSDYLERRAAKAVERLPQFPCTRVRSIAEFACERGWQVADIAVWQHDYVEMRGPLEDDLLQMIKGRWPEVEFHHTPPRLHEAGFDYIRCPDCQRWLNFPLR